MSGCDGASVVAASNKRTLFRAGAKRARAGMNPLSKTATNPKGEVAN